MINEWVILESSSFMDFKVKPGSNRANWFLESGVFVWFLLYSFGLVEVPILRDPIHST